MYKMLYLGEIRGPIKKRTEVGRKVLKRMVKQKNVCEWDTNGFESDDESWCKYVWDRKNHPYLRATRSGKEKNEGGKSARDERNNKSLCNSLEWVVLNVNTIQLITSKSRRRWSPASRR